MPTVLLFAQAREAAGTNRVSSEGSTVAEVLDDLRERLGSPFAEVLEMSRIWCNGEPVGPDAAVGEDDELAVLPPVSGG